MNKRFYALTHVNFDIESMIANATEENRAEILNHILWHIPDGVRFDESDRDALVADITAALSGTTAAQTDDENNDEVVNNEEVVNVEETDENLSEINVEE